MASQADWGTKDFVPSMINDIKELTIDINRKLIEAAIISFVREPITLPGREGKLFKLSNEMLDILADKRKQTNIQLRLVPLDANENKFTIN